MSAPSKKSLIAVIAVIIIAATTWIFSASHQEAVVPVDSNPGMPAASTTAAAGEHCGGNMTTARSCVAGYHCAPNPQSHLPFGDVGGLCISN